jgi:hypothetical protein
MTHRCGVAVERVEPAGNVIHDFIVAAAKDPNEASAADARFAETLLKVALPNQDPDVFPSCTVVIEQFDRLERHHEALPASPLHRGDPPSASRSQQIAKLRLNQF